MRVAKGLILVPWWKGWKLSESKRFIVFVAGAGEIPAFSAVECGFNSTYALTAEGEVRHSFFFVPSFCAEDV